MKKQATVSIPAELLREVDDLATAEHRDRSAQVTYLIEVALGKRESMSHEHAHAAHSAEGATA